MASDFDDVFIREQYSTITSRTLVDVGTTLWSEYQMKIPVISANMPQITENPMAHCMIDNGGLGILHRFCSIEKNVTMFCSIPGIPNCPRYDVGVSIGVKSDDIARFDALYEHGARVFCIDVAMGNHENMKSMIESLRSKHSDLVVIAGNVSTADGAVNLAKWGAQVVKIGVGPGSHCETRKRTGVGTPQFYALREVKTRFFEQKIDAKIIADGGIRNTSDITKSMIFADAVMVGAILAGTTETPGRVYPCPDTDLWNRQYYKVFGGSSSAENKDRHGNTTRFVEGRMTTVPFKGHAKYILREIQEGLQSSYSYSNSCNTKEFQERVIWGDGIHEYRGPNIIK